jgi:RNase P/RNase MRP subunit POP5
MKLLKPSNRERKRYLLIIGEEINFKKIEECIIDYIGILGHAKASPQLIRVIRKGIIISINREMLNNVRASFLISGRDIKVIKVSGSIKNLKDYAALI